MIEGHIRLDREFNRDAAVTLCERGAKHVDGCTSAGGYQFTRDLRAKAVRNVIVFAGTPNVVTGRTLLTQTLH